MTINPTIQANNRIVYLKDIPEAVALKQFIEKLDKKYNVDSTDSNNTFGRINLDRPIIRYGVPNTLYLACAEPDWRGNIRLPQWANKQKEDNLILLDKRTGGVKFVKTVEHTSVQHTALRIEPKDIETLTELRKAFKRQIHANAPQVPIFTNPPKSAPDENLTEAQQKRKWENEQNEFWQKELKQLGYANSEECFTIRLRAPLEYDPEHYGTFTVSYHLLKHNKAPYFSTTFDTGTSGGQCQHLMHPESDAYKFYKKWDDFHCITMTITEFNEMKRDLEELTEKE